MENMDKKGHTSTDDPEEWRGFVCPVCGRLLHEMNLVDQKGIVEENLFFVGGVKIVNSRVELHCNFQHQFNEEGFTVDDPHLLVGVVCAAFDGEGNCIEFHLEKILPEKDVSLESTRHCSQYYTE